ncbi:MAG: SCP2 sterol-binding domain-containing protein [Chitinophagales bacterium]|nr:SCP2 sterol-binding domain-containing protein [Chitinophagales bacterium]
MERLVAAIFGVGGSDACLDFTLKYMNEREAFGKKIKKFQVLRHEMVQLHTELEAGRQLTYHTAWLMQNGEVPVKECTMAKLYMTELGNKIVDKCLQMFGGYGYMEDFPIARAYRDSRVGTIVGGTSQIMREILAKIIIDDTKYKKVYSEDENVEKAGLPWGKPETAREIIESIPLRLKKDKAKGYKTLFHFDISGDTGGQFTVKIEDGVALVTNGLSGDADCTVTAEDTVYADVELGKTSPEMAFMSGQIKVNNLGAMMQFVRYFKKVTG